MIARLLAAAFLLAAWSADAADWPQWMGARRDGVWDEKDAARRLDLAGASLVWETPAGGGYAGPAVSGGRVFIAARHAQPVSDTSKGLPGEESLRCHDAADGRLLWERRWPALYRIDYPSGPRATPTVHDDCVYFLGAEGRLACCATDDGRVLWMHELQPLLGCTAPTWGFAGHPLVFEDLVIVLAGGDGTTCVAFDRRTGAEKWRALSSRQAGYCPPTLVRADGRDLLVVWHGEAINGLDPRSGKVLWSLPRETRFGVSMASPVAHGDRLLVSAFWWGSRMMRLVPDGPPETIWETQRESDTRTEHLNALMCTPLLVDGHLYGVCSYGQLRCLEWDTGRRKWETFAATSDREARWGNAFLTRVGRTGNDFLVAGERGELVHAALDPEGFHEKGRHQLIAPDCPDVKERKVVWSHPAYAGTCVFWRNDSVLRCWRIIAP